jgi:integrase
MTIRLERIKNCLGTILVQNLNSDKIDAFFEQFASNKPKYRNHFRDLLKQLIQFAIKMGALPNDRLVGYSLKKEYDIRKQPSIIKPNQLKSFLSLTSPQVMPYIVLGSFAGLRPEEVQRLTWEDYLKDENNVLLNTEVTKMKRFRTIPKNECLKQWMDNLANKTKDKKGKIATICNVTKSTYVRVLKEKFGGPLGADAQGRDLFRHCYVSYRCADTDWDFQTVANETGHSVQQLKSSYLKLVGKRESKEWFSTFPDKVYK